MKTIVKFPVPDEEGPFELSLPRGARVLGVARNDAVMTTVALWALVDPNVDTKELRKFAVFGAGEGIQTNLDASDYLGMFQLDEPVPGGLRRFFFHVFELRT